MSIIICTKCDKAVDTDYENDIDGVCEACAELTGEDNLTKEKILKEIRSIVSRALNNRSDTKRIIANTVGDYVSENTKTMLEIEKGIRDI